MSDKPNIVLVPADALKKDPGGDYVLMPLGLFRAIEDICMKLAESYQVLEGIDPSKLDAALRALDSNPE